MTRREFLKRASLLCLGAGLSSAIMDRLTGSGDVSAARTSPLLVKEASFYKKIDDETVQCGLCPRRCTLSNGQRSFCRVREPKDGKLYTAAYGSVCSAAVDPIEKKPLFHFLPGTLIYSIATAGCNFRCKYCQNWQISQAAPEETYNRELAPEAIVDQAILKGCPTVAYTYTEPAIFYEYMLDAAKAAKGRGIRNMYHSNGSLNPEPAEEISLYLDAADIDLKGFTQEFYTDVCAGDLATVLNTLKVLKKNKVWLEITNLIVPALNDDMNKLKEMCVWINGNLGSDVPVHFSRFWPQHRLTNLYPTPVETLERARGIAMSVGLNYVYVGNVPGHPSENTYCPKCKTAVIKRSGYFVLEKNVNSDGSCRTCGYPIAGVWA